MQNKFKRTIKKKILEEIQTTISTVLKQIYIGGCQMGDIAIFLYNSREAKISQNPNVLNQVIRFQQT